LRKCLKNGKKKRFTITLNLLYLDSLCKGNVISISNSLFNDIQNVSLVVKNYKPFKFFFFEFPAQLAGFLKAPTAKVFYLELLNSPIKSPRHEDQNDQKSPTKGQTISFRKDSTKSCFWINF